MPTPCFTANRPRPTVITRTPIGVVMNIATSGGTLVDEIVHPYMAANFPECPSWFNEGLASLYEQCGEENGRIHGDTNWRLAGLQKAIRSKKLPPFKSLLLDHERRVLRERPRRQLRPSPLPAPLPATEGAAAKVLPPLPRQSENGPDGLHQPAKGLDLGNTLLQFQKTFRRST